MEDFSQMVEVQRSLVAPWEVVEKVVRDFYREVWVDEPGIITLTEGLVEVLVLMETKEVLEEAEGTLVGAAEKISGTPVLEEEDLITPEKIRKMNVATKQLAMVR